jgi:hypothetical protein
VTLTLDTSSPTLATFDAVRGADAAPVPGIGEAGYVRTASISGFLIVEVATYVRGVTVIVSVAEHADLADETTTRSVAVALAREATRNLLELADGGRDDRTHAGLSG